MITEASTADRYANPAPSASMSWYATPLDELARMLAIRRAGGAHMPMMPCRTVTNTPSAQFIQLLCRDLNNSAAMPVGAPH
jgi:hypothetical protein